MGITRLVSSIKELTISPGVNVSIGNTTDELNNKINSVKTEIDKLEKRVLHDELINKRRNWKSRSKRR